MTAPANYSRTSTWDLPEPRETPSWESGPIYKVDNIAISQREDVAGLVMRLRLAELREMAIDIIDTALIALREANVDPLRENIGSWLETADITISTRRNARAILDAREEGRAQFGTARRPLAQERRKAPRKER